MRRPRDPESYIPAIDAAAGLRQIADQLERARDEYPLIKWSMNIRLWNPDWETTKPAEHGTITKVAEHFRCVPR